MRLVVVFGSIAVGAGVVLMGCDDSVPDQRAVESTSLDATLTPDDLLSRFAEGHGGLDASPEDLSPEVDHHSVIGANEAQRIAGWRVLRPPDGDRLTMTVIESEEDALVTFRTVLRDHSIDVLQGSAVEPASVDEAQPVREVVNDFDVTFVATNSDLIAHFVTGVHDGDEVRCLIYAPGDLSRGELAAFIRTLSFAE